MVQNLNDVVKEIIDKIVRNREAILHNDPSILEALSSCASFFTAGLPDFIQHEDWIHLALCNTGSSRYMKCPEGVRVSFGHYASNLALLRVGGRNNIADYLEISNKEIAFLKAIHGKLNRVHHIINYTCLVRDMPFMENLFSPKRKLVKKDLKENYVPLEKEDVNLIESNLNLLRFQYKIGFTIDERNNVKEIKYDN